MSDNLRVAAMATIQNAAKQSKTVEKWNQG
jgi:hypothetical protein